MCVVCCRAYATFLKKIVDTRDVSDVRNRRDLHGLIDGTKLPPQSVLHDAKRLTQARLYASVGSMSYDRLRALLTFAMTDVTNTRHVAIHGDAAVDSSKMAIITSTILQHLCRDKSALKDLSPINHIHAGLPPTLIFHGEADTTVPFSSAEFFTAAMKKAGNRCELVGFPGETHGFFNRSRATEELFMRIIGEIDRFLASLKYYG